MQQVGSDPSFETAALRTAATLSESFARHRQTGEREAVIGMTPLSPYGRTGTLTANPPRTGGPQIP
jgi:hypothetical protein